MYAQGKAKGFNYSLSALLQSPQNPAVYENQSEPLLINLYRKSNLIRVLRMTEVASSVVHEVLGRRAQDVDEPIIDYIINVLADEDFDFGLDGEGAFEAVGELLVGAGCVNDFSECRSVSL